LVIPALVTILPDTISVSPLLTPFDRQLSPLMAVVLRLTAGPMLAQAYLVISLVRGGLSVTDTARGLFE
jgi:hypothetical protein